MAGENRGSGVRHSKVPRYEQGAKVDLAVVDCAGQHRSALVASRAHLFGRLDYPLPVYGKDDSENLCCDALKGGLSAKVIYENGPWPLGRY